MTRLLNAARVTGAVDPGNGRAGRPSPSFQLKCFPEMFGQYLARRKSPFAPLLLIDNFR